MEGIVVTELRRLNCYPVYLNYDQYAYLMQFQHDKLHRRVMKALAFGVAYGIEGKLGGIEQRSGGLITVPVWVLPEIKEEDYKS